MKLLEQKLQKLGYKIDVALNVGRGAAHIVGFTVAPTPPKVECQVGSYLNELFKKAVGF